MLVCGGSEKGVGLGSGNNAKAVSNLGESFLFENFVLWRSWARVVVGHLVDA